MRENRARTLAALSIAAAACSRSTPSATHDDAATVAPPLATPVRDAEMVVEPAAAPRRARCAEPRALVQLGTVKERASFREEILVGRAGGYAPEDLAPRAAPPAPAPPAAASPSKRYTQVVGSVGLIHAEYDYTAVVEDVATRKKLADVPSCTARGAPPSFALSSTGRFVLCYADDSIAMSESRPSGSKKRAALMERCADGGLVLAPDDSYGVTVPRIWAFTTEPTRDDVMWCQWSTMTSRAVASAPHPGESNAFGVAFCESTLFAVSLEKEIAVFRGADGARLAAAPARHGGEVSFSQSGRYLRQSRGDDKRGWATTVYRLDP